MEAKEKKKRHLADIILIAGLALAGILILLIAFDMSERSIVSAASSEDTAESEAQTSQVSLTGSTRQEEKTETGREQSAAEISREEVLQPSQKVQEQSKTQSVESTEESRQEPSVVQEPESTVPEAEISEEASAEQEAPTGRYIDGTYKSVAEVDGVDEEGFLYDLEVTVTVSGGKITAITGKIKNDRSDDPSANEAYVRRAVKKLSESIIDGQGTNGVDVISNATYSSNAVLKAASEAIAQADTAS